LENAPLKVLAHLAQLQNLLIQLVQSLHGFHVAQANAAQSKLEQLEIFCQVDAQLLMLLLALISQLPGTQKLFHQKLVAQLHKSLMQLTQV
jgi:hypothetical protein